MDVRIDGREPPLARGGPAAVHSCLIPVVTPVVGVQKFNRMVNPVDVRCRLGSELLSHEPGNTK
jgi:hypothetical protein